jgi:uncharacterized protein (DUF1810 family)
MSKNYNLERFLKAQETKYQDAFSEIKNGRKTSHWMWYIFPQIAGLGFSEMSQYYAIEDLAEAKLYLEHKILGNRLLEISKVLLETDGKTAHDIFGSPDDFKLKSSMTLFSLVSNSNSIFEEVLQKYFNAEKDIKTMNIINKNS